MMQLVFATNNKNKIYEVSRLVEGKIKLLSLADIHCDVELPETSATIEGNALQKAKYVFDHFKMDCFADDTGLEIEGLDERPGVISARYAGEGRSAEDNMDKVLEEMKGMSDRKAVFRTVIALIIGGKQHLFEGKVEGVILKEKKGGKGFGYDPIFSPQGQGGRSFAEMPVEEKNIISHRALAVQKLVDYLKGIAS